MTHPEMTVRDYFAGLAMQAALTKSYSIYEETPPFITQKETSIRAYRMADAMMEARKG